jgi:hypothetical protein
MDEDGLRRILAQHARRQARAILSWMRYEKARHWGVTPAYHELFRRHYRESWEYRNG